MFNVLSMIVICVIQQTEQLQCHGDCVVHIGVHENTCGIVKINGTVSVSEVVQYHDNTRNNSKTQDTCRESTNEAERVICDLKTSIEEHDYFDDYHDEEGGW